MGHEKRRWNGSESMEMLGRSTANRGEVRLE
jgi:hypothetical protein